MTYEESYRNCKTVEELTKKVKNDCVLVFLYGANPDRYNAIEDAVNVVVKENGWTFKFDKE